MTDASQVHEVGTLAQITRLTQTPKGVQILHVSNCLRLSDEAFRMRGLGAFVWAIIYFCSISFEMAYAKHVVGSVPFDSLWGPVLHNNLAAIPVMGALGIASGELALLLGLLAGTILVFEEVHDIKAGWTLYVWTV